ncbi:hypothetical protein OROGR_018773 [Orobanche gracilis]
MSLLAGIGQSLAIACQDYTATVPRFVEHMVDINYMAGGSSNESILQQLRQGTANFELTSSPVASITRHCPCPRIPPHFASLANATSRFFARVERSEYAGSPTMKKVERFSVQKVTGDGRCLFRALGKRNGSQQGHGTWNPGRERECRLSTHFQTLSTMIMETFGDLMTDELRMAVKEVICDNDKERLQYEEALLAITIEESLLR